MPRTKYTTKKKSVKLEIDQNTPSNDENIKEYIKSMDQHFKEERQKLEAKFNSMKESLRNAVSLAKLRISPEIGNKPLKLMTQEDMDIISGISSACIIPDAHPIIPDVVVQGGSTDDDVVADRRMTRNRSRSVEDFQLPEDIQLPPRRSRSRSLQRSNLMVPPPVAPRNNKFRTPNVNLAPGGKRYNLITPKVQPDCPMSILRRPRDGEVAFAVTGSPLLVSSGAGINDVANVNFTLPDGRVMSILPQLGLRPHDMPAMETETLMQLQRLRENLNSILGHNRTE